jgi:chloride channel 3/4/5
MLTIYLTASTSFVTRKGSGVLSPDFATPIEDGKVLQPIEPHAKRKVLLCRRERYPVIKTILSGTRIIAN